MPDPSTQNIWPAIWSATAASCSAFAAIQILRINRVNQLEAARPTIVPEWETWCTEVGGVRTLVLKKLKNAGRGPAINVHVKIRPTSHTPSVPASTTLMQMPQPVFLIPEKETHDVGVKFEFDLENLTSTPLQDGPNEYTIFKGNKDFDVEIEYQDGLMTLYKIEFILSYEGHCVEPDNGHYYTLLPHTYTHRRQVLLTSETIRFFARWSVKIRDCWREYKREINSMG